MAAKYLWRWRALTVEGELQQGTLWAADRESAWGQLSQKALCPLALKRNLMQQKWQTRTVMKYSDNLLPCFRLD